MNVKEIIDSLGKAPAVAEALNITPRRIYGWIEQGTVPFKWRPHIARLAREKDVPVSPEISAYAGEQLGGAILPQPTTSLDASNASNGCSLSAATSRGAE